MKFWKLAMTMALALMLSPVTTAASNLMLYVAPEGNDRWSGRYPVPDRNGSNGPLATLEGARDAIRTLQSTGNFPPGGVTVEVRGTLLRDKSFQLTAADSGRAEAPITYRGVDGARLWGGRRISGWHPVDDAGVLRRLNPAAHAQVLQTNLKAQGISDYGIFQSRGHGGVNSFVTTPELFFGGKPMQLARWPNATPWPNEGYETIAAAGGQDRFTYTDERPARWASHKDIWLHGYWSRDWGFNTVDVESIDIAKKEIVTRAPHGIYGYTPGFRFFYTNVLEELDTPGEWYLDREAGVLYFWPPEPLLRDDSVMLSTLETPLIDMDNVEHVRFEGLTLEYTRGIGVRMNGGRNNRILGCTIRNIGTTGVVLEGGFEHSVRSSDINYTGGHGVLIRAGDRATLTLSGHEVHNCHFHHIARQSRTYFAAVHFAHENSGGKATNNLIHDMPHTGIFFDANDVRMERNELYNLVLEGDDAGAVYAGRDWTYRGNVFRHNFLHHNGGSMRLPHSFGTMGLYMDDCAGGTLVEGNIFQHVSKAVFAGGGRDTKTHNNIFVDCAPAYHIDERGFAGGSSDTMVYGTMKERFYNHKANEAPFAQRYPDMLEIHALYQAGKGIPPTGCTFERNIVTGSPEKWISTPWVTYPEHFTIRDNIMEQDPHFVDRAWGDFRLRPDSPARRAGFEPIPLEQIGLVKDEYRTHIERIESKLEMVRAVTTDADGGATGSVRLTLRNRGDGLVADVEHVAVKTVVPNFMQGYVLADKQPARIEGGASWNFRLAPGQQAWREFDIVLPPGGAREYSLLQIDTRGERARPARLRTEVVYPLNIELEIVRPLIAALDAPAGHVRIVTANAGDAIVTDQIEVTIEPVGVARFSSPPVIPVHLQPGARTVNEFDIVLQDALAQGAVVQGRPHLTLNVEAQQARPVLLRLPLERPLPRLDATTSLDNLGTALAGQPEYGVRQHRNAAAPEPFARFRLGVAGDKLALFGRITDPNIAVTDLLWTGSSIEVFGNTPGAEKIGQIFLVPATGDAAARAFKQQDNAANPAPEIQVRSTPVEGGYEIAALVPLELLAIAPGTEVLRFEIEVTTGLAAGGTRRGSIFGSAKAYSDAVDYGTARIK